MIYVLWEIFLPLVLAVGVGFAIAYLAFRWRRRLVHASEWNALSAKAQKAEIEAAEAGAARGEAENERTVLSSKVADLTSELEAAQQRISELQQRLDGDGS